MTRTIDDTGTYLRGHEYSTASINISFRRVVGNPFFCRMFELGVLIKEYTVLSEQTLSDIFVLVLQ